MYNIVSPLVTSHIVVPRLAAVSLFRAKGGRCSPALSSSSVNDNYIIVRRSHFFIRKNTKNTGIQLITLPLQPSKASPHRARPWNISMEIIIAQASVIRV